MIELILADVRILSIHRPISFSCSSYQAGKRQLASVPGEVLQKYLHIRFLPFPATSKPESKFDKKKSITYCVCSVTFLVELPCN